MERLHQVLQPLLPTSYEEIGIDHFQLSLHTIRDLTWVLLVGKHMIIPMAAIAYYMEETFTDAVHI